LTLHSSVGLTALLAKGDLVMNCRILALSATVVVLLAGAATADIICVPDPLVLSVTAPTGTVVVDYTGGGATNLYGFSIDVRWDHSVATGVFSRPDTGPFSGSVFFFVVIDPLDAGHVRVDAAIGADHPGITSGDLFKAVFTAVGIPGTQTVLDLTIEQLYDPDIQPVVGGPAEDGLIVIEDALPVVSDVVIANTTLTHTDDYVKNTDGLTITAVVTDDEPAFGAANITADLTAFGGDADAHPSYAAPTATWTIAAAACAPADGELTVTVTATDNSSNVATGSDTIIADNTPPAALAGVTAQPRHQKIRLSWSDISGNDAHPYGIEFRQVAWGDYPDYDTTAPAYPANHGADTLAVQLSVTTLTTTDWTRVPRDIYYVAGFVYDWALNYSPAGTANTARATNYWLGDVAPAPDGYDGYVDAVNDVDRLADTYGLADIDDDFDAECNVGPTDISSPRGIPLPNDDDEVGFEDLMVFALNYTIVSPALDVVPSESPVLAWRQIDETTWTLALEHECAGLKGLDLSAELPVGVSCQVVAGEALASQPSPVFLHNVSARGLDAGLAVMGQGVGLAGYGELMQVTFSEPVAITPAIVARGLQNEDLSAIVSGITAVPVPAAAGLEPNYPNPFNPRTTISFSLPVAEYVQLVIYSVDGAELRRLVDEPRAAGRYTVVWDGLDDHDRPAASGTYLYRIQMGEFRQIRKMALMR
jgi:hypothetical protein